VRRRPSHRTHPCGAVGNAVRHAFHLGRPRHWVVADIALRQLDADTRQHFVETLRRHPRFEEDFARLAPTEGDRAEQDCWAFQHAATWPDQIRKNNDYDIRNGTRSVSRYSKAPGTLSLFPKAISPIGTSHKRSRSTAAPSPAMHPVWIRLSHTAGYFISYATCTRPTIPRRLFATGIRTLNLGGKGGNLIRLVQSGNPHSLWDGLLGRTDKPNDVKHAVFELTENKDLWKVDRTIDIRAWVAESHELANSFVYCQKILDAVAKEGEVGPINLPEAYLNGAGDHARKRIVVAGLRLAAILSSPAG
jgi:hypothetical protein